MIADKLILIAGVSLLALAFLLFIMLLAALNTTCFLLALCFKQPPDFRVCRGAGDDLAIRCYRLLLSSLLISD